MPRGKTVAGPTTLRAFLRAEHDRCLAGLGRDYRSCRPPSVGRAPQPIRPWQGARRALFVHVAYPHALSLVDCDSSAPSSAAKPPRAIPLLVAAPFGSASRKRRLSPTSATNVPHEHPSDRVTPGTERVSEPFGPRALNRLRTRAFARRAPGSGVRTLRAGCASLPGGARLTASCQLPLCHDAGIQPAALRATVSDS